MLYVLVYSFTGFSIFIWLHLAALGVSLLCWKVFGLSDYSKFKQSGPFRVGVREFRTEEYSNDCTIYYPAASDGSGKIGIPYLAYGANQIKGLRAVIECSKPDLIKLGDFLLNSFVFKPLALVTIPAYKNANPALNTMQPVFFSHGLTANRRHYSALCMELASCGYCVVALTHNDGSADYSSQCGAYDKAEMYDYWVRNFGCKVRSKELRGCVKEVTSAPFLKAFGTEWKNVKLSGEVVLMGHSFGGITALTAAQDCP
jgi:pimeloyl-ACP methyl ester carboxylesterase